MMDNKTIVTALIVGLIGFLSSKYVDSIVDTDNSQDIQIDSLKAQLQRMEELQAERDKIIEVYNNYFNATIDSLDEKLKKSEQITIETIETIESDSLDKTINLDSIIFQIKTQ